MRPGPILLLVRRPSSQSWPHSSLTFSGIDHCVPKFITPWPTIRVIVHVTVTGAFAGGSKGALLGAELVGLIIEILWVGTLSTFIFGTLKLTGMLRVSADIEKAGLDDSKHGGSAYSKSANGSIQVTPATRSSA